VPDLAGWRLERLPEVPATAALTLAPDWVCEVLSPSTERLDREEKKPTYAREGVRHLWLVGPLQRSLEVYRLEAGHWTPTGYHQGPVRIRAEPFEAFELNLGRLWLRQP
jgi:Uma2 family endonuclease